jgi:hypothetical protein
MKTKVLFALIASAVMLVSFSLISGSPKKANPATEHTASGSTGGFAIDDIQR